MLRIGLNDTTIVSTLSSLYCGCHSCVHHMKCRQTHNLIYFWIMRSGDEGQEDEISEDGWKLTGIMLRRSDPEICNFASTFLPMNRSSSVFSFGPTAKVVRSLEACFCTLTAPNTRKLSERGKVHRIEAADRGQPLRELQRVKEATFSRSPFFHLWTLKSRK